eukprot:TRINITY_DN7916_c0_g1_i1.p1 TRINITY_DN7916_c0_g1~~TRINITY_DN7916_c0_g1_i1.p1  ORF type:complete len:1102 (+),score=455.48 TRINITY_DN7916_c0_g1_i1:92-3307(+)
MRNDEHRAMAQQRLDEIGGRGEEVRKPTKVFLSERRLEDVSSTNIFHCDDTEKYLMEDPGELVRLVISRAEGSQISDKWVGSFLMSMYQAVKRHNIAAIPSRIIIQSIKEFEKCPMFSIGVNTYNALLSVMYQEKVDIKSIFSVYSRFKDHKIKPNHQTFALLFNASLRAHRTNNSENFFKACSSLLSSSQFSYAGKVDIINTISFGISDAQHTSYAIRLITLLRSLCVVEGATPMVFPERPQDRNGSHLYLSAALAERVFASCSRCRSPDLLDLLQQWLDFLGTRGITSQVLNALLMRNYAANGDIAGAFRLWDSIVEHAKPDSLSNIQIKYACIHVLEAAARSRAHEHLERSRAMMETMVRLRVITKEADKIDLFIMQIKLLVMINDYHKAKELYEAIKKDVNDSKILLALFSGPSAKDNLPVLKEIFLDFKALTESNGKEVDSTAVDKYLGLLADNGEFQELLAIMKSLSQGQVTLDIVNRVLQACARDKDATSYGTFYKWSDGSQDDMPLFFSHLKNNRTTKKNCYVAQQIFDTLKEHGLAPTTKTYNNLMNVYAAAGDHEEVSRLYHHLKNSNDPNIRPDQFSFYYVARAWAGKGAVDMVESVFNELLDTSKKEASKSGAGKEAQQNPVFTPELCAQAIRALANTGMKIETVAYMRNLTPGEEEMDWLEDLPTKVISTKQPRPVEVDMGFKLINALKELGVVPTVRVYAALLGLCTRAGDFERAELVYDMLKKDTSGNEDMKAMDHSDIVTSLMKMHYTRQNMDDAIKLLDEITQSDRCRMDLTAFHNCISTCALHGHVPNARYVLQVMFQDPMVKVTDTAIALALVACAHSEPEVGDEGAGRLVLAKEILNEQRELHKLYRQKVPVVNSQHVFHKLLYVCAKEKDLKEAIDVLQEMRELKVIIDKVTMLYVARCLSSVSDFARFWNIMDRERVEPDTGIVFRLLQVTQNGKDPMAALDIITKYPQLCNEKLHLLFYNTVENTKLSKADYEKCDARFTEAFGTTLKEVGKLKARRVKEQALEASEKEKTIKEQQENLNKVFDDLEGSQEEHFGSDMDDSEHFHSSF